jgi:hypothetical protein
LGKTDVADFLPDFVFQAGDSLIKKMSDSAPDSYRGAPPAAPEIPVTFRPFLYSLFSF